MRFAIERALSFALLQESQRRKAAETSESETRAREFVQQASHGIYRSTPDGRFLDVNPAMVGLLGYDNAAQVLALDIGRDVYADREERRRLVAELAATGTAVEREVRWRRAGGNLITVRLHVRPIFGADRRLDAIEATAEDVTQRALLEEQLRQAQKMEAIGRLAGGVAHDFNNLLTAILGYSELLLERLAAGRPDDGTIVEEIRKAAERAAALTRQLLAFSRQQVLRPARARPQRDRSPGIEQMLRRLIGEDIELALRAGAGRSGPCVADPGSSSR